MLGMLRVALRGALLLTVTLGGIAVGELLLLQGRLERNRRKAFGELETSNHSFRLEVERRTRAKRELMMIKRDIASTQKDYMLTLS